MANPVEQRLSMTVVRLVTLLSVFLAPLLVACEMDPGDVLDEPRVLAIRADPPTRSAAEPTALSALVFGADGQLRWRGCATNWTPADPVSCAPGAAELGTGNPIALAAEDEPDDVWLMVEVAGALPAVRKLSTEGSASNPELLGLSLIGGGDSAPVAPGARVEIGPDYAIEQDPTDLVVTWYTTAGEIAPARTVETEAVTLTLPEDPGSVTVIGVVRDQGGGVTWASTTLDVRP